jgi:hypothetical protein
MYNVLVEIGWICCQGSFGPGDTSGNIKQEAMISSGCSACGKEGIFSLFDYRSDRIHHIVNDYVDTSVTYLAHAQLLTSSKVSTTYAYAAYASVATLSEKEEECSS